jgi:sugar phosphate isomerase/epimerase
MNIALSSIEHPPGELESFLDFCRRMDVDAVELLCPQHVTLATLPAARAQLQGRGFKTIATSNLLETNRPGSEETARRQTLEAIAIASELGASRVVTYFGANPAYNADQAIAAFATNIEPCLNEAEKLGITLVLENEFDFRGEDPTDTDITHHAELVRKLVEYIGSPNFRVNFDPTNFLAAGEEAFPRAYELLKDVIGHVHIKDATRYDEIRHGPPEKHVVWFSEGRGYIVPPAGQGAVNWDGILTALKKDGYSGWLTIECHVPLDSLDSICLQTLEYVRPRL